MTTINHHATLDGRLAAVSIADLPDPTESMDPRVCYLGARQLRKLSAMSGLFHAVD